MAKSKLTVIAERADPDIVEMLEKHLAMAKEGKLRSVAIASAGKGGAIATDSIVWSQNRGGIYLAIEKLKSVVLSRA